MPIDENPALRQYILDNQYQVIDDLAQLTQLPIKRIDDYLADNPDLITLVKQSNARKLPHYVMNNGKVIDGVQLDSPTIPKTTRPAVAKALVVLPQTNDSGDRGYDTYKDEGRQIDELVINSPKKSQRDAILQKTIVENNKANAVKSLADDNIHKKQFIELLERENKTLRAALIDKDQVIAFKNQTIERLETELAGQTTVSRSSLNGSSHIKEKPLN